MASIIFGYNYGKAKKAGGFDADAQAFFTAASITDSTQKNAVNQLVLDLKSYNIWTKMKAIYPIVGGTASSHAVNLKTPGTYNLTFATGMTHSSTGMTGNGTTGYANTNLIPSSVYGVSNNGHLSYYSRTDSNGANEREIGALTSTNYSDLALRYSNNAHTRWGETSTPTLTSSLNSLGFYIGSRTGSTTEKLFKNGAQILTSGLTGNSSVSVPFFIGAINFQGSPNGFYSIKQCAFASIGDGLTDTEAANFYTAVQAYQTTLSRNV